MNTLYDLCRKSDGISAILAADARPTSRANAADKVLEFARQLIAMVAIQFQDLQMLAKKVVLQRLSFSGVERFSFGLMPHKSF